MDIPSIMRQINSLTREEKDEIFELLQAELNYEMDCFEALNYGVDVSEMKKPWRLKWR